MMGKKDMHTRLRYSPGFKLNAEPWRAMQAKSCIIVVGHRFIFPVWLLSTDGTM